MSTQDSYLYANSMQTAQRRIPVGGDGGKMKTWSELAVVYQSELDALKENIKKLKNITDHWHIERKGKHEKDNI